MCEVFSSFAFLKCFTCKEHQTVFLFYSLFYLDHFFPSFAHSLKLIKYIYKNIYYNSKVFLFVSFVHFSICVNVWFHAWVCNKVVTVYICKGKWKASFEMFKHDLHYHPSSMNLLIQKGPSSLVPTAGPNSSASTGQAQHSLYIVGFETALIALTERDR